MIIVYCPQSLFAATSSGDAQTPEHMGADKIYRDDLGLPWSKPGLTSAIAEAKAGDVLVVARAHHLAMTSRGVMRVIRRLAAKGAGLRILNTPIDTSTTTGRMVLGSTPLWSLNVSPLRSFLAECRSSLGRN